MSASPSTGRIITFYAFKGGTGRTMAAVSAAVLLAESDADGSTPRVLLIDFDLEAPGITHFLPLTDPPQGGVFPLFRDLLATRPQTGETEDDVVERVVADWSGYVRRHIDTGVDVLPAGTNASVATELAEFPWTKLHDERHGLLVALRRALATRWDWVIIDSRTGLTDTAGLCTMVFPDVLVPVFTPNAQSLLGLVGDADHPGMVGLAMAYRASQPLDARPLRVLPLPCRVEMAESDLLHQWRQRYTAAFTRLFQPYQGDDVDLRPYFEEVFVPHQAMYAYGERIAAIDGRVDNHVLTLRRRYEVLVRYLRSEETAGSGDVPPHLPPAVREPQRRTGACLTTDIAGFATMSRSQQSRMLVDLASRLRALQPTSGATPADDVILESCGDGVQLIVPLGSSATCLRVLDVACRLANDVVDAAGEPTLRAALHLVEYWPTTSATGVRAAFGVGIGYARRLAELGAAGVVLASSEYVERLQLEADAGDIRAVAPHIHPDAVAGEPPWEVATHRGRRQARFYVVSPRPDMPAPDVVDRHNRVSTRLREVLTEALHDFIDDVRSASETFDPDASDARVTLWVPMVDTPDAAQRLEPLYRFDARREHAEASRIRWFVGPVGGGPVGRCAWSKEPAWLINLPVEDPDAYERRWLDDGVPIDLVRRFTRHPTAVIAAPAVFLDEVVGVLCVDLIGRLPPELPHNVESLAWGLMALHGPEVGALLRFRYG